MSDLLNTYNNIIAVNNNIPLLRFISDNVNIDVEIPNEINETQSLRSRLNAVTFEKLYKNLASYHNICDCSNYKYITKTYYIDNENSITVTVDSTTPKKILTTISGSTGISGKLIKTTTIVNKKYITIYTIEE